jgi:hypothetical protein
MSAERSSRISCLAAVPLAVLLVATLAMSEPAPKASAHEKRVLRGHVALRAAFVPSAGQFRRREPRYVAQGAGYTFAFTRQQVELSFAGQSRGAMLSLRFVRANPGVKLEARTKLAGKVNYLIGRDPAKWRTGLPTYRELVYRGLWPGIDLHVRGEAGRLKYEFRVRPGADPSRVRLAYQGAQGLSVTRTGSLAIATPLGVLQDARPVSYQLAGAKRVPVVSAYALHGGDGYGFALGRYDRSRPLVIDPGLEYSTYLGGSDDEGASPIAVEGGYAYVSGCTVSDDFPTTPGAFQTAHNPSGDYPLDVFVTKLAKDGSSLVYSTYLGGSDVDCVGNGIALEGGRAYVEGVTFSTDFPTTPGAFRRTFAGGDGDGFVTELSKDGSALVYSTYLGGSGFEQGSSIAVEGGNTYVTGPTDSTDFPTTAGAFERTNRGALDVFVTKLAKDGSGLIYSTLVGGSDEEESDGIAVEGGLAYLTGLTRSADFPTTPGAFQPAYAGGDDDAFATTVARDGSSLRYSTFLGGTGGDHGVGIAVEGGDAYISGITGSTDFPTTPGAFQRGYGGGFRDAFVTKVGKRGTALGYSTYLGGTSNDAGLAIAVEGGRAYVAGRTGCNACGPGGNDFPTTADAFQPVFGGFFDVFMTKLPKDGSALDYSTYLGGSDFDEGDGIAIHGERAYVAGGAGSGFPVTPGAFQPAFAGGFGDAFVTKLKAN